MTVGKQVRARREALGLTQLQLAVAADVALSTVQNIENGRNVPGLNVLAKLAKGLGCTASDVLDDVEKAKAS